MQEQINFFSNLSETELLLLSAAFLIITALKGFALWEASKQGKKIWFIALLFLNTLGILELIFLFAFSDKSRVKEG